MLFDRSINSTLVSLLTQKILNKYLMLFDRSINSTLVSLLTQKILNKYLMLFVEFILLSNNIKYLFNIF